jgi:hypothetical protein
LIIGFKGWPVSGARLISLKASPVGSTPMRSRIGLGELRDVIRDDALVEVLEALVEILQVALNGRKSACGHRWALPWNPA